MDDAEQELDPLLALARHGNYSVKYQQMRKLLPRIVAAREAHVPHRVIIKTLKTEYGLDIDPGTYGTYLFRLRAEAKSVDHIRPDDDSLQMNVSNALDTTNHKTAQGPKAIETRTEDTPRPRPAGVTAKESRLRETETTAHSAMQSTKPPGMTHAAWIAEQARAKPKKH